MDDKYEEEIKKRQEPITETEIEQAEGVIQDYYMPYRKRNLSTPFPILKCFYKKKEYSVDDENKKEPLLGSAD